MSKREMEGGQPETGDMNKKTKIEVNKEANNGFDLSQTTILYYYLY